MMPDDLAALSIAPSQRPDGARVVLRGRVWEWEACSCRWVTGEWPTAGEVLPDPNGGDGWYWLAHRDGIALDLPDAPPGVALAALRACTDALGAA